MPSALLGLVVLNRQTTRFELWQAEPDRAFPRASWWLHPAALRHSDVPGAGQPSCYLAYPGHEQTPVVCLQLAGNF